jgi:predicted kinase
MSDLVLINGLPGTGKTTLAAKLKDDLGLPCLGKDMLKEFLFDTIGIGGRDDSRLIGKATAEMLYLLANDYVQAGRSIILECAYFVEFAQPEFQRIANAYPVRVLEIYCETEKDVRRERFRTRNDKGLRHPGHVDQEMYAGFDPDIAEPLDVYAPIQVGKLIRVDTTRFGEADYRQLLTQVKDYLKEKNNG